jgi:hypothetical protein
LATILDDNCDLPEPRHFAGTQKLWAPTEAGISEINEIRWHDTPVRLPSELSSEQQPLSG